MTEKIGSAKRSVAIIGNMSVDIIKEIDVLPARSELVKIRSVSRTTGGCACNTGIDLAILDKDLTVKICGITGTDADSEFILDNFRKQPNIDVSQIKRRGETAFTDVISELSLRTRTFYQFPGSCDSIDIADVDIPYYSDCSVLHAGYLLLMGQLDLPDAEYGTRMARLLSKIRKSGIKTSVDIVSETGDRFKAIVPPSLPYVDYLTINELEAGSSVGISLRDEDGKLLRDRVPEVIRRLRALGTPGWIIIHTPEICFGSESGEKLISRETVKLPKGFIVGSVGAGDAFCAGVLLAIHRELGIADAIEYGNASALVSLRSAYSSGSMVGIEEALEIQNGLRNRAE